MHAFSPTPHFLFLVSRRRWNCRLCSRCEGETERVFLWICTVCVCAVKRHYGGGIRALLRTTRDLSATSQFLLKLPSYKLLLYLKHVLFLYEEPKDFWGEKDRKGSVRFVDRRLPAGWWSYWVQLFWGGIFLAFFYFFYLSPRCHCHTMLLLFFLIVLN